PPAPLAAALARPMIELAGELADGVIFNLFPLARYRRAMTMLHRGAERGGRDPGSGEVYHLTTAYRGAAQAEVTDATAHAVPLVRAPAPCRARLRAYQLPGATMCSVFPNPVGESRAA